MNDKSNEPQERSVLARGLARLYDNLGEVESAGRLLNNQNFADLIKAARGRILQAMDHPDLPEADKILAAHAERDAAGAPFPNAKVNEY